MWTCPDCQREFVSKSTNHSCNDRTIDSFFEKKSETVRELYDHFVEEYEKIGDVKFNPAKSMITIAGKKNIGYVNYIGKDFIDVALTFDRPYEDNLCFYRIGGVPGGKIYQHYLRMYQKEDINDEVRDFMKMALDLGNQ